MAPQPRLSFVDLAQFLRVLEGAVFVGRSRPRYVRRPRDMSPPQGSLLRVVWHVQQLASVLSGASHVDESSLGGADLLEMRHYVFAEGPDLRVIPLRGGVLSSGKGRYFLGHLPAFGLPFDPSSIHHLDVLMAEQAEDPQSVRGPPVVPIPVEDDRSLGSDALLGHEGGEVLRVEVVAHQRIV